jgi:hypothetical protein
VSSGHEWRDARGRRRRQEEREQREQNEGEARKLGLGMGEGVLCEMIWVVSVKITQISNFLF